MSIAVHHIPPPNSRSHTGGPEDDQVILAVVLLKRHYEVKRSVAGLRTVSLQRLGGTSSGLNHTIRGEVPGRAKESMQMEERACS